MVGYTVTWTLSGGEDTGGNPQKYPSKTPSPATQSIALFPGVVLLPARSLGAPDKRHVASL